MAALAQYALPGIVVVSALGAVIVCLVVLRYGFGTVGDEDPDDSAHRLFVTRFGHALAVVCFASAAMLAVVGLKAGGLQVARAPLASLAPAADSDEIAALREDVRRLEDRLNRELAALEERVTRAEAGAADRRARVEPRAEPDDLAGAPPPTRPAQQRAPVRSRRAPAPRPAPEDREAASALPADVSAHQLRATVRGVRVDVQSRPGRGQETLYTIRLSDSADRPLAGADVTLHGQMADGSTIRAMLDPGPEPGVYRARLTMTAEGPRDLRLRVVQPDRRFELSLAQAVSW